MQSPSAKAMGNTSGLLLSAVLATLTLLLLAALHVLSPEFDPSWRMVSEYANGSHAWVLSAMFGAWALSSWALGWAIWRDLPTLPGKIGVVCC